MTVAPQPAPIQTPAAIQPKPTSLFGGANFLILRAPDNPSERLIVPAPAQTALLQDRDGVSRRAAVDAQRGAMLAGALSALFDARKTPEPHSPDATLVDVVAVYDGNYMRGTFMSDDRRPRVQEALAEV